jgi:glutamate synthase domain-containing protein 2
MILTGMGNPKPYPIYWDHMLIDACQVTNPSIDPLREPMELRTYLGAKPEFLEFEGDPGNISLKTELAPQVKLDIPIVFAAMSYGAISLNAHKALAMAARRMGTLMNTGEGGLHEDLAGYTDRIIVQQRPC